MGKNKPIIGFILGIIVAVVIFFANIPGLERTGQMCMAFSLMTVIFWAFGIAQPGYVSGLYLLLLAVFKVAANNIDFFYLDYFYDVSDHRRLSYCGGGERIRFR